MEHDVRIVFTAGTHWISRLIRWVLRSRVSHVFIEYPSDMWGGRWVAEATKGGVRKVPSWKARKHVHSEFRCKFDARPGMSAAAELVGKEYDYPGAILLGVLVLLWRWFRVKLRHPLRSTKAQFCSEFVARILWHALEESWWDPEQSQPGKLLELCETLPSRFEKVEPCTKD